MPDLQFFADEQISNAVISGLKRRGVSVLSTHEAGRAGMTDESHVAFCKEKGYVLVTEDEDFLVLARSEPDHNGIIFARQSLRTGSVVRGVLLIAEILTPDEMFGRVEFLQPD